ncbi:MAG: efflux transporter outer membrane subunit [Tepidisphaeraceae bacterium]
MRAKTGVLLLHVLVAAVALVTAGCTVGPNYQIPAVHVPTAYQAAAKPVTTAPAVVSAATQSATPDLTCWWQTFHDPALNRLIREAVDANLDVRLAATRIRQARAELEYAQGALLPTADASGSYSRSRYSASEIQAIPGTYDLYQAGFDAGWEIDVFGGARRAVEAARDTLQAQTEARRDTLVTLLGEVAQNYIMLRGYQHERQIIEGNIRTQIDTLSLQKRRQRAGVAADLPIAQAEAQLESTRAELPVVETAIQNAIHRLSVLLDRDVSDLQTELSIEAPIPAGPAELPPGLPSELLRRRPDIRHAERNLAAATANIGVATADLYPKFSLLGDVGLGSSRFRSLGNAQSLFWSIGPSASWNLFNGGQVRANIRAKNAMEEQAMIQYRQTIIQAVSDVEDAIVAYRQNQIRRDSLRAATTANRRSLELARRLNDAGVVDFLNVLDAQQSLYLTEDQLAQSEQSVSTSLVALYKALGGGWEMFEESATAPREHPAVTQDNP